MSRPIDEEAAPRAGSADRSGAQDDAARAKKRDQNRRYRERHPEQVAATRRRWVDANRDRVRESNRRWRAEHLERAREQGRDSMRRSSARKRREALQRARGRERAKRWREEHPERVRDYQKRWVQENRGKVREYYNRYYATHRDEVNARAASRRDADPERTKRARKAWAERNKDRRAEQQRERRSDPAVYQAELDANAAARRLKRRLERAGLPPKRLHPTTAAERRAHEKEAAAYFGDPNLPEHARQLGVFTAALTEHMLEHGELMREFAEAYVKMRERMGLPAVDVEQVTYARAAEIVTHAYASRRSTDVAGCRGRRAEHEGTSSPRGAETTVLAIGGGARHAHSTPRRSTQRGSQIREPGAASAGEAWSVARVAGRAARDAGGP